MYSSGFGLVVNHITGLWPTIHLNKEAKLAEQVKAVTTVVLDPFGGNRS